MNSTFWNEVVHLDEFIHKNRQEAECGYEYGQAVRRSHGRPMEFSSHSYYILIKLEAKTLVEGER